jgi:hypothetical protein
MFPVLCFSFSFSCTFRIGVENLVVGDLSLVSYGWFLHILLYTSVWHHKYIADIHSEYAASLWHISLCCFFKQIIGVAFFLVLLADSFVLGRAQRHDQDGKGGREGDQEEQLVASCCTVGTWMTSSSKLQRVIKFRCPILLLSFRCSLTAARKITHLFPCIY